MVEVTGVPGENHRLTPSQWKLSPLETTGAIWEVRPESAIRGRRGGGGGWSPYNYIKPSAQCAGCDYCSAPAIHFSHLSTGLKKIEQAH